MTTDWTNPPILNVQKHLSPTSRVLHLASFSVPKTGLERNLKQFKLDKIYFLSLNILYWIEPGGSEDYNTPWLG